MMRQAVELEPENFFVFHLPGRILSSRFGMYDAIGMLEKPRRRPERTVANRFLALTYETEGRLDKALGYIEKRPANGRQGYR